MKSFVIFRTTVEKGVRVPKVRKKKTREERDEYIRMWENLAKELRVKK